MISAVSVQSVRRGRSKLLPAFAVLLPLCGLVLASRAPAALVDTAVALKYDIYAQNASGLTYQGSQVLFALEFTEPVNSLSSGDTRVSNPGFSTALHQPSETGLSIAYSAPFTAPSHSVLDNNFPNGTYRFELFRPETFDASVVLTGNNYPGARQLTNFPALQSHSAGNTATVTWNRPGGSLSSDFLVLTVSDGTGTIYSTPDIGRSGSLDGNATSATVLIPPGRDSVGTLMVVRPVFTSTSANGDTLGAYGAVTSFPIHSTAPVDTTAPQIALRSPALDAYAIAPDAEIELTFDEPMRERGNIGGLSITNNRLPLLTWSEDHRSVRVRWPQPFPKGPVTLKQSGTTFMDLSGNPLATGTTAASFFVGTEPVITQQPTAQLMVAPGEKLQITAVALWPGLTLTYQWYRNGELLPGATQTGLTVAALTAADIGVYQLRITNEYGSVWSAPSLVQADLSFYRSDSFNIVYIGLLNGVKRMLLAPGATLEASAVRPSVSATQIQWRREGVPIPGATGDGYTWSEVQAADSGVYDFTAMTPVGPVASGALELVISTDLPLPVFQVEPLVQKLNVGQGLTLGAPNLGVAGLARHWLFNGVPLPGQHDALLQLPEVQASQAGRYQFVVSNGLAQVILADYNMVLTKPSTPTFLYDLGDRTISEGSNDRLSVVMEGSGPFTFQWRKDGVEIPGNDPRVFNSVISSSVGFNPFSPADVGTYVCVVSNGNGSVESKTSVVAMHPEYAPPTKPMIRATRQVVLAGGYLTLDVNAGPLSPPVLQRAWKRNGVVFDSQNQNSYYQLINLKPSDSGDYSVVFTNDYGSAESDLIHIQVVDPAAAPAISGPPEVLTVNLGAGFTLTAPIVSGLDQRTIRWRHHGQEITSSAPDPLNQYPWSLTIAAAQPWHAGDYTVEVTNPAGNATTVAATVTVLADTNYSSARLVNISTRAMSGAGDATVIAGFVISGPDPKRVLIRGLGATLQSRGVGHAARHARITLYHGNTPVASNTGWTSQLGNWGELILAQQKVGTTPLAADVDDSCLLAELQPGAYSVHLGSDPADNGDPGVGLVEIFDADPGFTASKLVNLSTRAFVGLGEQIAIPGLVITGTSPKTYLFRAVGPTLVHYGVAGNRLADPYLRVYNSGIGEVVANDNWENAPNLADMRAAASKVGAFELDPGSTDAAVLVTLKPGVYSVLVNGAGSATGIALIEAYEVP